MKFLYILIIIFGGIINTYSQNLSTVFESSNGKETATYQQIIDFYTHLAHQFSTIQLEEIGVTDAGLPLHLITFNPDAEFNFDTLRKNNRILLINNGIHPGESDGIDASMMLLRDLATGKITPPKHTVICAIAVYNVGGCLNRNSTSRTNQNGPKAYGFRGNARNFDLNRDFIKADTKNAQSFSQIFHRVQPDVFIDNHVSNGANYQYTLTHLFTQHNKLGGDLGKFLNQVIKPELEDKLVQNNWDITPYVNVFNRVPESGFTQFMDYPRYSTGYTTLWNTFGMMVETHMLKPYQQRVDGTYQLMKCMIEVIEKNHVQIHHLRQTAFKENPLKRNYTIRYKVDTTKSSQINFKGFEGEMVTSQVTGLPRLKYNENKPFVKTINYQDYFIASKEISIPKAYIIPQGWWQVIERLRLNQVAMKTLVKDTVIEVESYTITNYSTNKSAYEGHYNHSKTEINKSVTHLKFRAGDYIIPTNQKAFRYLIETLEPQAYDSFFNWNFFDTILQQKEHFSPYVWEDKALELLNSNPHLKAEFTAKKQNNESFANNWYAQLDWLHKKSAHYEKAHFKYPIYRVL